jgi:hypothetical protein
MSSTTPVNTYILINDKHTLDYTVFGIPGTPLTQFNIQYFTYKAVFFIFCASVFKSVLFHASVSLTGVQ